MDSLTIVVSTIKVPYYNIDEKAYSSGVLLWLILAVLGIFGFMSKYYDKLFPDSADIQRFILFAVWLFLAFILALILYLILRKIYRDKLNYKYKIKDLILTPLTKKEEGIKKLILREYYSYKEGKLKINLLIVRFRNKYYFYELRPN